MPNTKLIVGNWKMNPATLKEAKAIATKTRAVASVLKNVDVVACPPLPYVAACGSKKKPDALHLGAQTVSEYEGGAHTGDVSVGMLRDLGVEYVIAGHSEEREAGMTDDKVNRQISAILAADLTAIVCVGEKIHDENGAHLDFLTKQMNQTFAGIPASKAKKIVVAYEPIWAIGAKQAMSPEEIYEMSLFIKKVFADLFGRDIGVKVKVLYGGSVNSLNAAEIIKIGKVDGLLVGRESISAKGFPELLKAVDSI